RRHTSSKRDWSSDVCSSDLPVCPSFSFLIVTHALFSLYLLIVSYSQSGLSTVIMLFFSLSSVVFIVLVSSVTTSSSITSILFSFTLPHPTKTIEITKKPTTLFTIFFIVLFP